MLPLQLRVAHRLRMMRREGDGLRGRIRMPVRLSFVRVLVQHTRNNRMHPLFEDIDAWGLGGRTGMHITRRLLTLPLIGFAVIDAIDQGFLRMDLQLAGLDLPARFQNLLCQNLRIVFLNLADIGHVRPFLGACSMFARLPRRLAIMHRLMHGLRLGNGGYSLLRRKLPIEACNLKLREGRKKKWE